MSDIRARGGDRRRFLAGSAVALGAAAVSQLPLATASYASA
ncbi:twin-arginine translocation signal domain-containing protein, partial [Streptomyces beijiangensis]|nr:twin-arginine translocation signal domain-containing protein [Streptomyces beijiangensis]